MSTVDHAGMAARRRTVAREKGRRRRTMLLATLAGAALLSGGWWVVTGPPGRIASVSVSGYDGPNAAALEQTIDIVARRGTVLEPPVARLREAAMRFPWVEDIVVQRDLPRGVSVDVITARPVAIGVPAGGARVLVSDSGRILGPVPAKGPALTRVKIPGEAPAAGARSPAGVRPAVLFAAALPSELGGQVVGLQMRKGALVGRLATGPELRLGLPEDLAAKAQALELVLSQLTREEERQATYVDISVADRPAVGGVGNVRAPTGTAPATAPSNVDQP